MEKNACQCVRKREQRLLSIREFSQLTAEAVETGGDSFLGLRVDRAGSVEFLFDCGPDKGARVREAAVPDRLFELPVECLGNANAAKSSLFLHMTPAAKALKRSTQDCVKRGFNNAARM